MTRLFSLAPGEKLDFENPDPKGTYRVMKTSTPGRLSVGVTCFDCGIFGSLDHEVAADGKLSPSLVCPYSPCTFHDYGQLEGWTRGALTQQGDPVPA